MITQDRLKELMHYDPETGVFTRKVQTCSRVKVGMQAGTKDRHGHFLCLVDGKRYSLHRLAWLYVTGSMPNGEIDHISGDKSDNRFSNLRDVSHFENMQNVVRPSSNNKTGFLGVVPRKGTSAFMARIRIDGKNVHLGTFDSPEKAHEAYVAAKRQFHAGCTL